MCVYFQGEHFLENKLVKDKLKWGGWNGQRMLENKHVYMECRFSVILRFQVI